MASVPTATTALALEPFELTVTSETSKPTKDSVDTNLKVYTPVLALKLSSVSVKVGLVLSMVMAEASLPYRLSY